MASLLTGVRRCSRWLHKVTHGFAPAGVSQCSGTHRHHSVCFPVGLKHLHTYSLSALPLGSAVTYRLSARPASHAVIGSPGVTQAVWPPSHAPLGRSIALYGSWVMSGTPRAPSAAGKNGGDGDPHDPSTLAFWIREVEQLPYAKMQALLRARGLPACQFEEEEWEAYRRLKEKAPPGEHVESSTPTDISMPGVRELPASRAASKQQQQQWQKGQGQGQGRALLASGSAASKQQGQGQQQPGGVVGKGESEAATRAKLQDVQCAQGKRGPLSSRKKAKKQKSPRQRLRAQLAQKLQPGLLDAFTDAELGKLTSIGCVSLECLALVSAEDLRNAGLLFVPIRILQFASLIGRDGVASAGAQGRGA